jgi:cysteine-rich repeat protein
MAQNEHSRSSALLALAVFGALVAHAGCGSGDPSVDNDTGADTTDTGTGDTGEDIAPIDADDTGDATPDGAVDADAAVDADSGDTVPADTDAGADADVPDLGPDVPVETCGDGVLDEGEACDDGNEVSDDRCANDCSFNIDAWCSECSEPDSPCTVTGEVCVETGHGAICAVTCSPDDAAACPEGFACEEQGDGEFVCVPEVGVCFSCGDGVLRWLHAILRGRGRIQLCRHPECVFGNLWRRAPRRRRGLR